MIATLGQSPPAHLIGWKPDQDLQLYYSERARYLSDDDIQAKIAQVDHILWMAVEAEIEHSTEYLVELASERAACSEALQFRARRGYEYRGPAPRKFSRDVLDNLKAHISLAEEIGRTVKLVRRGKNYVAHCPFHKPDRTPSFTVFTETRSYHCFGCQAHGDIFNWLMEIQGMTFPEAVRDAAARCGFPLASTSSEHDRAARSRATPDSRGSTQGAGGVAIEYLVGKLVAR